MKIQILGTGCPKCKKTAAAVEAAVNELGLEADIEKITDLNEIMTFNVMSTPAVAIDGKVKIAGRVPSQGELKKILNPSASASGAQPKQSRKKLILIIALLAVAVLAVIALKNHKPESPAVATDVAAPLPRLLDLGAGKCIPCKMMVPILDELKETYAGQLKVEFIDVWENEQAGQKHGIRMIPTQIFYDASGNELFRHEGFFSKEDILSKWKELGVSL